MVVAWVAGAAMAWFAVGGDVEWVAHRGESADAPENTLAAFRLAWERGVKAIELDVHLANDGTLIVCHDKDLKRTAGKPIAIKDITRDDVRGLDAGSWKGPKWKGEPVPTLDEALATIPEKARCFIEVKVGAEAIPSLVESVRKSGKTPEQLAVISFQADAVAESKKRLPELKAYYLASFKEDKNKPGVWTPSIDSLIAKAKEIKADGLDLAAKGPLDADDIKKIKQNGLEAYVWTVDDPAEARRFVEAGVDGITTNKAAWMMANVRGQGTARPGRAGGP